jgi:vacuolar-type H+-ATPase subunit I/STV1
LAWEWREEGLWVGAVAVGLLLLVVGQLLEAVLAVLMGLMEAVRCSW